MILFASECFHYAKINTFISKTFIINTTENEVSLTVFLEKKNPVCSLQKTKKTVDKLIIIT